MLSLRKAQREATARRVLDAARDLFEEIGYEEATIRAIATRAGVSVGSVFTTFRSKIDVLNAVMEERLAELYVELDRLIPHLRGSTADRCRSMFAVHYAFEMRRVRLFLAFIAASYAWRADTRAAPFGQNARLRGMVRAGLEDGVARGELRRDIDFDMAVDLLLAAYSWNYRVAAAEDAGPERLTALMDRQIGVIFAGFGHSGGAVASK